MCEFLQISLLEERVSKLDNQVDSLLYKLNHANDALRNMQQEVDIASMTLRNFYTRVAK